MTQEGNQLGEVSFEETAAYWKGLTPAQKELHVAAFYAKKDTEESLNIILKEVAMSGQAGYVLFYFTPLTNQKCQHCIDLRAMGDAGEHIPTLADFELFLKPFEAKEGDRS